MPELALRLLQQQQPALTAENAADWLLWEKKRMQLLRQLGLWQAVLERSSAQEKLLSSITSSALTLADRAWLQTQQVQALIETHQYPEALNRLQKLLWQTPATDDFVWQWRQQLIDVYLGMDDIDDAERAMRRYGEDYADKTETIDWKILQAQMLLRAERPQEAYQAIQYIKQPRAVALTYLAQMQSGALSPQEVAEKAQNYLQQPDMREDQRVLFLYLQYQAAVAGQNESEQIQLLSQLVISPALPALNETFLTAKNDVAADQLWRSYEQHALQIGNRLGLLQGDDDLWLIAAMTLTETEAKSVYALLILQPPFEGQAQAVLRFSELLQKQPQGLDVLRILFSRSARVSVNMLPLTVRYVLVDQALSRGDLKTAAQLMQNLQQPPEGQDRVEWELRRARVLILSGQYAVGANVLQTLAQVQILTDEQTDRYLQVAFDLQNVQQHELALQVFASLGKQNLSSRNRRELAYWKAESLEKMSRFEQAAVLYLESAPAPDGSFDPWYHTASFRAAEALAQAGLISDAHQQFLALLKITSDPARQTVIRQQLQNLRLQKNEQPATGVRP